MAADRRKIRDYIAAVGGWKGLLGRVSSKNNEPEPRMTATSSKPWLLAQAKGSVWGIYWRPKALGGTGPLKGVE